MNYFDHVTASVVVVFVVLFCDHFLVDVEKEPSSRSSTPVNISSSSSKSRQKGKTSTGYVVNDDCPGHVDIL